MLGFRHMYMVNAQPLSVSLLTDIGRINSTIIALCYAESKTKQKRMQRRWLCRRIALSIGRTAVRQG
jgi:hypothetical protein